MITWEPWDPANGSALQPLYSLARLADGTYDAYIARWAAQVKAWGGPLRLRFAHEMNGNWYPWGSGVNGNTAPQYVSAWRHVHDLFVAAGATNVTWVWTPNVIDGMAPIGPLYPGDAYVDWVGVDGYNWGTTKSWSSWQSFNQVFGSSLGALRQLTTRPIVIGETASTEMGGSKSQWIQDFFAQLKANTDIKAFIWFNLAKETDWRIESSSTATQAFRTGVSDSRYRNGA
jgi:beta-mannanase